MAIPVTPLVLPLPPDTYPRWQHCVCPICGRHFLAPFELEDILDGCTERSVYCEPCFTARAELVSREDIVRAATTLEEENES